MIRSQRELSNIEIRTMRENVLQLLNSLKPDRLSHLIAVLEKKDADIINEETKREAAHARKSQLKKTKAELLLQLNSEESKDSSVRDRLTVVIANVNVKLAETEAVLAPVQSEDKQVRDKEEASWLAAMRQIKSDPEGAFYLQHIKGTISKIVNASWGSPIVAFLDETYSSLKKLHDSLLESFSKERQAAKTSILGRLSFLKFKSQNISQEIRLAEYIARIKDCMGKVEVMQKQILPQNVEEIKTTIESEKEFDDQIDRRYKSKKT